MATSETVFRSTHDTVSSFAAGTNTAPTLTTATTTSNFSLPQTVLCTPMPGPSTFNPSASFAPGANLGAHSFPATPGQTPGLDPMDLTAALQSLTSAMTSMAARMQVLESTVATNPRPPSPVEGPSHAGVAFPPPRTVPQCHNNHKALHQPPVPPFHR